MIALQLVLNGVMAGAVLAVPAIGFTLIYAVLRFPNFAVGGLATLGAYAGLAANAGWGWPLLPALLVALVVAGVVGVGLDEAALARLRRQGALTAAIGSVALGIVLENVVRFVWGNDLMAFDTPILRDWRFGGLRLGPQQVFNAGVAVMVTAMLFAVLRFTRVGKMMRAVADNAALADLKGIDPRLVARLATGVGLALAGLGGMLVGLDTGIDPLTGFRIMLSVFAAAVVGGLGSVTGAVLGAVLVGVGEELSLLVFDPAYRTAVGFAAILLVLSVRPAGLLGERV